MGNEINMEEIPMADKKASEQIDKDRENFKSGLRATYPVGHKFLLEVEVEDIDGWFNMATCMLGKEFKTLTGCNINKVYCGLELNNTNDFSLPDLNRLSNDELFTKIDTLADEIRHKANVLKHMSSTLNDRR